MDLGCFLPAIDRKTTYVNQNKISGISGLAFRLFILFYFFIVFRRLAVV